MFVEKMENFILLLLMDLFLIFLLNLKLEKSYIANMKNLKVQFQIQLVKLKTLLLIMDFGIGESLKGGQTGAKIALAIAIVLIVLAGVWVW